MLPVVLLCDRAVMGTLNAVNSVRQFDCSLIRFLQSRGRACVPVTVTVRMLFLPYLARVYLDRCRTLQQQVLVSVCWKLLPVFLVSRNGRACLLACKSR